MDFEIGTKVVETAGFFKGSEFIVTGEYLGTNGTFGERKLISPELPKKTHTPLWIRGFKEPQYCEYKSSWKAGTKVGTPEEKALAKERTERRKRCMGTSSLSEILLDKPLKTVVL